jgi:hypothetical protein
MTLRIARVELAVDGAWEYAAYLRAHERRHVRIVERAIRVMGVTKVVYIVVDLGPETP